MNSQIMKVALAANGAADYTEQNSNKGWVNYGADNLFPQYLVDLYHSSPTHTALCNSIAAMIYGKGFYPVDLNSRLVWQAWDMDRELRKASLDFKLQGGFALEVLWGRDGTIKNVSHYPFENWRAGETDGENVTGYWYSSDWNRGDVEPEFVEAFNPAKTRANARQVFYVKPFAPGSFYYPKPDYIGALCYIELEKEIGRFHLNNIHNGLAPSFAIHFKNGSVDPEERAAIRRQIETEMSGAKGAGKVWITYSDLPELTPDFQPIQLSDAHNQYQFLSTECTDKIMVGHRVTNPMMFGVLAPGKLGGGQELEVSKTLFDEIVIAPYRAVIEETIKTLLNATGLDSKLELSHEQQDMERVYINAAWKDLEQCGEVMGDEWELIDSTPVDYELEPELDTELEAINPSKTLFNQVKRALWKFAKPVDATTGSSEQDNELFRVRYAYAPATTQENSRDFCRQMVDASRVYRKEDIIKAGSQSVNPGFGPNGSNTYSIWLYKGGARCHHFWERRTYMRKGNAEISVNEARRMITKMPAKIRDKYRLPTNEKQVAQRPVDMPNEGFLKPR